MTVSQWPHHSSKPICTFSKFLWADAIRITNSVQRWCQDHQRYTIGWNLQNTFDGSEPSISNIVKDYFQGGLFWSSYQLVGWTQWDNTNEDSGVRNNMENSPGFNIAMRNRCPIRSPIYSSETARWSKPSRELKYRCVFSSYVGIWNPMWYEGWNLAISSGSSPFILELYSLCKYAIWAHLLYRHLYRFANLGYRHEPLHQCVRSHLWWLAIDQILTGLHKSTSTHGISYAFGGLFDNYHWLPVLDNW